MKINLTLEDFLKVQEMTNAIELAVSIILHDAKEAIHEALQKGLIGELQEQKDPYDLLIFAAKERKEQGL